MKNELIQKSVKINYTIKLIVTVFVVGIIISISSCTEVYRVIFINYRDDQVIIKEALDLNTITAKVGGRSFAIERTGFIRGTLPVKYYVFDSQNTIIKEFVISDDNYDKQYTVIKDSLIILEIK